MLVHWSSGHDEMEGMARFRVNVFHQRGHVGTVIRLIPLETPTIDEMNLPAVLVRVSPACSGSAGWGARRKMKNRRFTNSQET